MRAILAGLAALLILPAPAPAERGLTTGFFDGVFAAADPEATRWIDRTLELNASLVRQSVHWRDFAPQVRPADFDPADPADPAYRWGSLDATVARLRARGLDVLLTVDQAPDWAEGPGRPRSANPGTWKPDPAALADFATALARRYSGTLPGLPRVRRFQLWNEPNLATYLTPQWTGRSRTAKPASPAHYRRMLVAFRAAIKRVDPANTVVAGGTSPFGDPDPGGARMPPARFVREMLCLHGARGRPGRCSPLRFDVLTHHPYSVGRPRRKALNVDDVSIPDLGKLTRALRRARRAGLLAGAPQLWVTEVSYDSRPPDPRGVPSGTHARWTAETLYLLWKQGARAVVWLQIRDAPPKPSYATSYQSGMFGRDGTAKLSARAFAFPLVRDGARVWGRSPAAGRLVLEARRGGRWRSFARLQVARGTVFLRPVAARKGTALRARVGDRVSLTWR